VDNTFSEWYWPAIRDREYWRVLSAHVAHLGWQHGAMNMLALALLIILFEHITAKRWLFAIGGSVLAVNIGLWHSLPATHSYVGLSGLLHGLILFALLESLCTHLSQAPSGGERQVGFHVLMVVALIAKLSTEQLLGPDTELQELIGGVVWVDSHLYGALGGGMVALLDITLFTLVPLLKARA
jgi:rhomboid family GlyGly-CTERM serine protease